MILLVDGRETGNLSYVRKVEQAYLVFKELQDNGVHRRAGLAVEKLSWGLGQLQKNMAAFDTQRSLDDVFEADRVDQNEARRATEALCNIVMDNTGMLPLEEPGLQSLIAPSRWAASGTESEDVTPSRFKQEEELQLHNKREHELHCSDSGRGLQGNAGSP